MRKGCGRLGSNPQKRQSKARQRFFGNRECWRVPHYAGQYHFVVAVWRAKEAESRAYENDNSPVGKFYEPLTLPVPLAAHSTDPRVLCACAGSASDLPARLLNERQYRAR